MLVNSVMENDFNNNCLEPSFFKTALGSFDAIVNSIASTNEIFFEEFGIKYSTGYNWRRILKRDEFKLRTLQNIGEAIGRFPLVIVDKIGLEGIIGDVPVIEEVYENGMFEYLNETLGGQFYMESYIDEVREGIFDLPFEAELVYFPSNEFLKKFMSSRDYVLRMLGNGIVDLSNLGKEQKLLFYEGTEILRGELEGYSIDLVGKYGFD